jgi:superfamily II DNA or RNA helicase
MNLAPGDRVRIANSLEEAEVLRIEPLGDSVVLTVVFYPSQRAERFRFSREELEALVTKRPNLFEDISAASIPRDPFVLFTEALRMRLAHTFDPHYAISVSQVDLLPHQVDAVYYHILPMPRIRFLLADDPGLGKTIMAGLVLKELKARRMVQRTLLVVPAHLQDQWKREMNDWFREDFVPLRRDLLKSLYSTDFFDRNPQVLVSMDFARRQDVKEMLSRQRWDLVVVDEAHKFSAGRYGRKVVKTQRYQLGEALAPKATHLLFLTATPHRGDDEAYFLLLSLLQPRLFANSKQLKATARSEGLPFVLRRTKEQVTDLQGRKLFRKRHVNTLGVQLTDAEQRLYEAVTGYVRRWYAAVSGKTDRRSRNVALALTVLQRRLSSSLFAVQESLRRRKIKLKSVLNQWDSRYQEEELGDWDEEALQDLAEMASQDWESFQDKLEGLTAATTPDELRDELVELDRLIALAEKAEKAGHEAKLQQLRQLVEDRLRSYPDEKLLIFSEFKDTVLALRENFDRWGFPCAVIHGQMSLQDRIDQERLFRDNLQVMVATDAAGEGINLQFCRLMVNYDLPWNPNRLEQRMGRIHRYGQMRDCYIFNLFYNNTVEGRVLERLMEKLDSMRQRLGDTVYDVIDQILEGVRLEELIMKAILGHEPPELEQLLHTDIERRVEQFRRVLEENALAGHFIDLSTVQRNETTATLSKLVPWDVHRFTEQAVLHLGGQLAPDRRHPGVFRISLPREFLKAHGLQTETFHRGLRIAFERRTARQASAEFFAPGHPLLEAMLDHFLQKSTHPVSAVLMDSRGRSGTLWIYRACLQDGRGEPVLERLVALFHDSATGQVQDVDPRMVWELEDPPDTAPLPDHMSSELRDAAQATRLQLSSLLSELLREAQGRRSRQADIKRRCLENSYDCLIHESNTKLLDYQRRKDLGEDMGVAIRHEEDNLKALIKEREERLAELEQERQVLALDPELEAVALILPKARVAPETASVADEDTRRRVEAAGMEAAMDYERKQGRQPQDVSQRFFGYDILSKSAEETRYIEVKAFATTGPLELTPHEWQMAQRLKEAYWLYVVENALDEARHLNLIRNPAERLQTEPVTGIVKFVVPNWKEGADQ